MWRSQAEAEVTQDHTRLEQMPLEDRPALVEGWYLRPFMYKGRTYVASYAVQMSENQVPENEMMLVGDFSYAGSSDPVLKRPVLSENVLCRFRMRDVGKK